MNGSSARLGVDQSSVCRFIALTSGFCVQHVGAAWVAQECSSSSPMATATSTPRMGMLVEKSNLGFGLRSWR